MIGSSKNFLKFLFILLVWACPSPALGVTPPVPAQPHQYVVDLAGVLDAASRTALNVRLHDLETQTTVQLVVLTIKSLDGEPIESFSHQTAVKWGIGQKGKDNGVLLAVAVKDRKYRIEVGYGLESTLPDSLVGSIGREYLVPNFKKGDYASGISAGVTEIINELTKTSGEGAEAESGQAAPAPEAAPQSPPPAPSQLGLVITILAIIVLLPAFALIVPRLLWARKRGSHAGFWSSSSGGGSSWSSSDSSSSDFSGGRRRFRWRRGLGGLVARKEG